MARSASPKCHGLPVQPTLLSSGPDWRTIWGRSVKNSLCIALWSGLFLLVAACEATNSPNARSSAQSIRTVFTTSYVFNGDLATAGGGTTGLNGADKLCQLAAGSVGAIVPAGNYIALLSTSSVNAGAR